MTLLDALRTGRLIRPVGWRGHALRVEDGRLWDGDRPWRPLVAEILGRWEVAEAERLEREKVDPWA